MSSRPRALPRALLWVVLGLVFAVAIFLAVSPELVAADPGRVFELVVLVLAAAVPGLVLVGWAAVRRHRLGLDDLEDDERARATRRAEPSDDRDR